MDQTMDLQLEMVYCRKCFICYKASWPEIDTEKETNGTGNNYEAEENVFIKSQLPVILLLRKFLSIPQEKCCKLLENYGDPCSWIHWCESCSVLVKEAENVFYQIKLLEKRFEKLQSELKKTIVESESIDESSRGIDGEIQSRPTEILRSYIMQKGDNFLTLDVQVKQEVNSDSGGEANDSEMDNPMSPMNNMSDYSDDFVPIEDNSLKRVSENIPNSSRRQSSRNSKLSKKKIESLATFDNKVKGRKGRNVKKVKKEVKRVEVESDAENSDEFSDNLEDDDYEPGSDIEDAQEKSKTSKKKIKKSPQQSDVNGKGEYKYKCRFCKKGFRFNCDRRKHERRHTGERPFQCPLCPKKFVDSQTLRQHNVVHTGEKPFICTFCDKGFSRKAECIKHEKRHEGIKNYFCQQCNKGFFRADALKKHEERFHTGETFLCSQCGKNFATLGILNGHLKRHEKEKDYVCEYCSKPFKDKKEFTYHVRTHTGERPHQCPQCPKSFAHPKTLSQHLKVHSGEKPYECSFCSKAFSRKAEMKKHEMLHTGEKPYLCPLCGKSFRASHTLTLHTRAMHSGKVKKPREKKNSNIVDIKNWPNADGKRYRCDFCGKPFNHRNDYLKHTRTHTGEKPYPCSQCNKDFTLLSHLRIHERIHTGEQPFSCDVCDKRFICASTLNKHKKCHSEGKPYPCLVCGKEFRQKHGLQKHEITHAAGTHSDVDNTKNTVKIDGFLIDTVELELETVECTMEMAIEKPEVLT